MDPTESMYAQFCRQRFPLPAEEQLEKLEERIATRLPCQYRGFLLRWNGGIFREPSIMPVGEFCPADCLTFLHGIGATDPVAELAAPSQLAIFDDNDPPELIPVGCTMMGGLILLGPRLEEPEIISLKQASGGYFYLADDIWEFFKLLRPEPL